MKLGEIKIEALKLMFANGEDDLVLNDAQNPIAVTLQDALADSQYRDYLLKMPGAINRCFSALERARVVPQKRHVLVSFCEDDYDNREFDLSEISDFDDIDRITIRNGAEYDTFIPFAREGDTIILPRVNRGDTVALMYYPTIERITAGTGDDTEIQLPGKIACLIPYFIKFDIYRDEDPAEANAAYQLFQSGVSEIAAQRYNNGYQTNVYNVNEGY